MLNIKDAPKLFDGWFPDGTYVLRTTEAKFNPSNSKGNPMIELVHEVVNDHFVNGKGEKVNFSGTKVRDYVTLVAAALPYLKQRHEALDLPLDDIDETNPDTEQYVGKTFFAYMKCEQQPRRHPLTEEQKAAGQKEGDAVQDSEGNTVMSYNRRLGKIEGLASDSDVARVSGGVM